MHDDAAVSTRPGSDGAVPASRSLEAWLEARRIVPLQWLVFVSSALVMLIDGFDLQALALAAPALGREWGVQPDALGWAFSLTLLGIGIGAALIGPLGDRWGRKPILIGALLLVAFSNIGSAFASSLTELAGMRLLFGIALGGANVNALALTTDYSPPGKRFLIMTLVVSNMAVGATLAGLFAPAIIEWWGWRGLFLIGGAAPLVLLLVTGWLPESLAFLASRATTDNPPAQLRFDRTLRRVAPAEAGYRFVAPPPKPRDTAPVLALFRPDLRGKTITLWLIYGVGAFNLFLVVSWLPTLLYGAGFAEATALRGSVAFQVGGVAGSLLLASLFDRGHLIVPLVTIFLIAGAALMALPLLPRLLGVWIVVLTVVGMGIAGTQVVILNIATALYPPDLRATSSGWIVAVARISGLLGPVMGGFALAAAVPADTLLALLAIPILGQALLLALARGWIRPSAP